MLAVWIAAALAACLPMGASAGRAVGAVRIWKIHYRTHNGARSNAYVLLPGWYGPRDHPPIPLVISPHGRGLDGRENLGNWGTLPAKGPFAVVSPDGQGRVFGAYSCGVIASDQVIAIRDPYGFRPLCIGFIPRPGQPAHVFASETCALDTVNATFGLALAAGGSFYEAARLANYAGGLVVMKRGTATITERELADAVTSDHDTTLENWSQEGPPQGRRSLI